jgi:hypothetical protein
MDALVVLISACLLGSIPTAVIHSQLLGKGDIRRLGDGNMVRPQRHAPVGVGGWRRRRRSRLQQGRAGGCPGPRSRSRSAAAAGGGRWPKVTIGTGRNSFGPLGAYQTVGAVRGPPLHHPRTSGGSESFAAHPLTLRLFSSTLKTCSPRSTPAPSSGWRGQSWKWKWTRRAGCLASRLSASPIRRSRKAGNG